MKHRLILLFILLTGNAFGQADYYQVALNVSENTSDLVYFQQALNTVLTKLTLDSDIANNPEIINALKAPSTFVKRYHYKKDQNMRQLFVQFHPKLVDRLIKKAELRKWSGDRPTVLIWAVNHNAGNTVFSSELPQMQEALTVQATQLGLPFNLPTMDLDDLANINEKDILTQNQHAISNASKRYDTDAVLTLVIETNPDEQLQSKWTLDSPGKQFQWQLIGEDYQQVVKQGLIVVRQKLAELKANSKHSYYFNIENVNSTKHYETLIHYLSKLPGISQVELESVTPNSVLYKLTGNTKIAAIEKALARGNKLSLKEHFDTNTNTIYYRFNT